MSEYQYYEFQSVDRPLTDEEQDAVGALSSRVQMTGSSAIFTYNYGDFPDDPAEVLANYFDAMFYYACWGTIRLMFRFPRQLVTLSELKLYNEPPMEVYEKGKHVILDLCLEETGRDYIEAESYLRLLLPLRQQILERDYRMLYLAWLQSIQDVAEIHGDEEDYEPPVPANLTTRTAALSAFIELLDVNPDLIDIAAKESVTTRKTKGVDYAPLIQRLPAKERDEYLLRLAHGEPQLSTHLRRRLCAMSAEPPTPSAPQRTGRFLLSELKRVEAAVKLRK